MNRAKFETYCQEHGWRIDHVSGDLMVSKYGVILAEKFEVGMDLEKLVKQMKEEDYGIGEVQGKFPFAEPDELQM